MNNYIEKIIERIESQDGYVKEVSEITLESQDEKIKKYIYRGSKNEIIYSLPINGSLYNYIEFLKNMSAITGLALTKTKIEIIKDEDEETVNYKTEIQHNNGDNISVYTDEFDQLIDIKITGPGIFQNEKYYSNIAATVTEAMADRIEKKNTRGL